MAVTSGFFNSLNGDRKYNAEQMSSLFDGIIRDGVFASIGDCFFVSLNAGNTINVASGRAWFDHAWVYNDAILPITADPSEVILDRYDAVVIEVNHTNAVRLGSIKIVKGTPASNPVYPVLPHTDGVDQYPIAYIMRKAGTTSINQADIKNMVGTSECPYITGILEVHNIDNIVAQWEAQWKNWSSQWEQWGLSWEEWFNSTTEEFDSDMVQWMLDSKANFDAWFSELQIVLEGDVATNLANRILELEERFTILAKEGAILEDIEDPDGDKILDSNGVAIEGVTKFTGGSSSGGSGGGSSKTVVTMLQAANWIGEDAPYAYDLYMDGVTYYSNQEIIPDLGITMEELDALQGANIQDGGQSMGVMHLLAFGSKPEIDLPIRVILRGGF